MNASSQVNSAAAPRSAAATSSDAPDPRDPYARLTAFLDEDTMQIVDETEKSGLLTARGLANGTPVVVFCSDARVQGGAMGVEGCRAIVEAYEIALSEGLPVIGLWHSGGDRKSVV